MSYKEFLSKDFFKKKKFSVVSAMHFMKLIFRSLLFALFALLYVLERFRGGRDLLDIVNDYPICLWLVWIIFMMEMVFRLFPSDLESKGCQKQFKKNYLPTDKGLRRLTNEGVGTFACFSAWIMLNGAIYWLYSIKILDSGIMMLIALAYSVCDMICILFYCPFQQWFLKNKCCGSCRIYNWDYIMMFTPLLVIKSFYTYSLVAASLVLLIVWELTFRLHRERFTEETNAFLACANCTEKLCVHKKALQHFLEETRERILRQQQM